MATLNDYVTITITRDTVGITAPGYGTPMVLGYSATWSDRIRFYEDLPSMVTDGFTTDSAEYLAVQAMLSQNPRPVQVAVGRGINKPTQVYALGVNSVGAGLTYQVTAAGKGVTTTTTTFTSLADIVFGAVNTGTSSVTMTAHGMVTGAGPFRVGNSGGALPTGLAVDTDYWIIVVDANTIKFASSKANAIALTSISLTTTGTGTNTLLRNNNDVVMAQIKQGLNATVGANYSAVQSGASGSTTLTVTALAAGNWFSIAINDPALLSNKETHVDPGIATDLTAILNANPGWYGLYTTFNSQPCVTATSAWVESNTRIYLPDVPETLALTTTGGTGGSADTLDALRTLGYARTLASYHQSPANMLGAAWLGRMLPLDPGSATFKFKTLTGVAFTVFTTTQRNNLLSRNGNGYENVAGLSTTFEGTSSDGEYLDAIVGDDWVTTDMQVRILTVMAAANKTEFEDTGIARVEAAVRATLKEAVRRKIYAASPRPQVTVPLAANVSTADKSTRTLPDIKWTATRSGAIHKTKVQGTVSL